MPRSAILENQFVGEGEFPLGLRIGELESLQELTGVGPHVLATRILAGEWMVGDLRHTIRLGLIGGGMGQREAHDLVQRNVVPGALQEYVMLAGNVIMAALVGVEDEPIEGEPEAPQTEMTTDEDFSNSVDFTSLVGLLDSHLTTSGACPSGIGINATADGELSTETAKNRGRKPRPKKNSSQQ